MWRQSLVWLTVALCAGSLVFGALARAQDDDETIGFERTPPRLSFTDGEVSFWRSGAEDWTPARVNTPLAAGDELYTGARANLELQVGARAFVRAGENTQLGLTSLEPDFLQLRVTTGHVSLDLRSLKTGQSFELDTPNAAFTVERSGYYRVEVDGQTTTFTSRRGGGATVTPAAGDSATIAASEQVVVSGTDAPQVESYAAPELDAWDRWNYTRTDDELDAVSARYVPSGVYGASDLDHYGDWRVVPTYGAVWVPSHLSADWAPYSTGHWLYDPYYGWTWVDDAPWGWVPYHYGRWVHISGYWGWCPGPIVVRPYYAPALVAFYGSGGLSAHVTMGTPQVGWVALGWGEPLVPWWGPARFRGHPRWAGWGGPRVVNNIVVKHKTVITINEINTYQNAHVRDAIISVDRDHFGRRSGKGARFMRAKADKLSPLHGDVPVKPDRSSLVVENRSAKRPPKEARERSVVAAREPRIDPTPDFERQRAPKVKHPKRADLGVPEASPAARVVQPPREGKRIRASKRPAFGTQSKAERSMPPPAPRFEKAETEHKSRQQTERTSAMPPERTRPSKAGRAGPPQKEPEIKARSQRVEQGRPESAEKARPQTRELPGEPANRVYRQRNDRQGSMFREQEQAAPDPRSERMLDKRPRQEGGGGSAGSKERGQSRGRKPQHTPDRGE